MSYWLYTCFSWQVVRIIDAEVTASMIKESDQPSADTAASVGAYAASFRGRRKRLTIGDVQRIAKRVSADARLDDNDVAAVEALVQSWNGMGQEGPLLHYQRQVRCISLTVTAHQLEAAASRDCASRCRHLR
jgi:hypothetical protein